MAGKKISLGSTGNDVQVAQELLNRIPPTLQALLQVDGKFGPKTLARVREFQRNVKLVADGVIGPKTWGMLDQFAQTVVGPVPIKPIQLGKDGVLPDWPSDPFRADVLRIGLAEALPTSKVGDVVRYPVGDMSKDPPPLAPDPKLIDRPSAWRQGWERLKEYIEVACPSTRNPAYWRTTGLVMMNDKVLRNIVRLDGVRGYDWRIPQGDGHHGIQWCGIFATWCWIKAGVPTYWQWGGPPAGVRKRWTFDTPKPEPRPGDILVQGNALAHHSILLPDDVGADQYLTLNGNSLLQTVRVDTIAKKSVVAIYSLEDFFPRLPL